MVRMMATDIREAIKVASYQKIIKQYVYTAGDKICRHGDPGIPASPLSRIDHHRDNVKKRSSHDDAEINDSAVMSICSASSIISFLVLSMRNPFPVRNSFSMSIQAPELFYSFFIPCSPAMFPAWG